MSSRYSPAAARGTSAAPASAALTRLPCAARHQLWHLVTPQLRSLLLLVFLPAAARAQAPTVVVSPTGPITLCAGSTHEVVR